MGIDCRRKKLNFFYLSMLQDKIFFQEYIINFGKIFLKRDFREFNRI